MPKHTEILRAIADSAATLLVASDFSTTMDKILAAVGPVTGACRAFFSINYSDAAGGLRNSVTHEWVRAEFQTMVGTPEFTNIDLKALMTQAQLELAPAETAGIFSTSDLSPELARRYELFDFRSILHAPVLIDGQLAGNIGLADAEERTWSSEEIDAVQVFARIIAAALVRERHTTELVLRERALELIPQGVLITDELLPGSPITYANPAFAELTRYERHELIGRGALSFVEADAAAAITERVMQAYREKRFCRAESLLKRKDGSHFLDHMTISMIVGRDGRAGHSIAIHEDVTDLRKREELLREALRTESVGQLTGGIAHDFNNLLTAIRSNAEDMREDFKDDEIHPLQADIVLQAAERGAGLVAQLMAFARKQELEPKVVDVNQLMEAHLRLLRTSLPAHIEIEFRKAPQLPPVYVDPDRLETAILNLVLNARDAMPDGAGTITIETMPETIDADYVAENVGVKEGLHVVIAVTDTGCGMPKDVLERAFVPFFTTKEVGKGAGLGLSMVYGFVKQSGGHAKIHSEVGLGTVVKIYLPSVE